MNERLEAEGVLVVHGREHTVAAAAMADAIRKTAPLVERLWNLCVPANCEAHVLTDCMEFIDGTTPPRLRFWVRLSKPLWRGRAERTFALAGGWSIPWRGRPVIGVKPPELLKRTGESLGDRLFVPVPNLIEKVRQLTCHEFTHACTAHLRLPPWLNEGLAMRAVDHMTGEETVLRETEHRVDPRLLTHARAYRRVKAGDRDALIDLYATGYWITRRLEDESPSTLAGFLDRRRPAREINRAAIAALSPAQKANSTAPERP